MAKKRVPRPYNNKKWTEAQKRAFIKRILRLGSIKWGVRSDAKQRQFVGRKKNRFTGRMAKHWKCERCGDDFPDGHIHLHHVVPVEPPEGYKGAKYLGVNWNEHIKRLFQDDVNKWQVLCEDCHNEVERSK